MTKIRIAKLWTYITECTCLLYKAYFKPYTLERWLRDIHSTHSPDFHNNPQLRRYAGQVFWLTTLFPLLIVKLIEPIYTFIYHQSFQWFPTCLFFGGWMLGLALVYFPQQTLKILLIGVAVCIFALVLGKNTNVALALMLGLALALMVNVARGDVALGVAFGISGGVVFGVFGDMALIAEPLPFVSMVVGVVLGVALSVALNDTLKLVLGISVAFIVGLSMILDMALSMTGLGMTAGVVLAMTWSLGVLRFYFWLPECLWMFILYFLSSESRDSNVKLLRYLPSHFDERIILPLPLMDQLIIKAYQEDPDAVRQTIDNLINSSNQHKVAAVAMVGIAVESLKQCQRLDDIADISNQLNWIPSPPPKELGIALPQMLDISQDVKAAVASTSPSRQSELLNRPVINLLKLEKSLVFEQNLRLATNLRNISHQWLSILETAQRTLEQSLQKQKEIRQVYIAGNALDPETAKHRFKGRIDIFREIENLSLADQPPVLLLYGRRRTGKTSALKYLPYKVGSTLVPLLVDLQGAASATTLSGLAENLATQIIEAARCLPQALDLPNPKAIKTDPFIALQNWLVEIERTHPSKRFLLNLDEFERLSEVVEATGSRAPLNFLRNILQHRRRWTLLFSGSHEFSELPDYWNDYLT